LQQNRSRRSLEAHAPGSASDLRASLPRELAGRLRTASELAASIELLLGDAELRRTLGERGRAEARRRFLDADAFVSSVTDALFN